MNTAFVIPIRGLQTSMSRLREDLDSDLVNTVVRKLLLQTVSCLEGLDHDIIIATADPDVESLVGNAKYVYDDGNDINRALIQVIDRFDYDKYFMIMPDLPGLSQAHVAKLLHLSELHPYLISNTKDDGTACAILPAEVYQQKLLGPSSSQKIATYAKENGISLAKLEIKDLLVDLDTIDDLKYWETTKGAIISR